MESNPTKQRRHRSKLVRLDRALQLLQESRKSNCFMPCASISALSSRVRFIDSKVVCNDSVKGFEGCVSGGIIAIVIRLSVRSMLVIDSTRKRYRFLWCGIACSGWRERKLLQSLGDTFVTLRREIGYFVSKWESDVWQEWGLTRIN